MSLQGYFIVYGSLAAVLALIIGGAVVGGPWGHTALALGILGLVGGIAFVLWFLISLNTDV